MELHALKQLCENAHRHEIISSYCQQIKILFLLVFTLKNQSYIFYIRKLDVIAEPHRWNSATKGSHILKKKI